MSLGIDLATLVPQLDVTAAEIVSNQKDALVERKEVAQRTKDFRKLDDNAKLTEVKSLLKCMLTPVSKKNMLTGGIQYTKRSLIS